MATSENKALNGDYAYEPPLVTADDWVAKVFNDPLGKVKRYFIQLFPILSWIYRYNPTWALGGTVPFPRFSALC